MKVVFFDIQPIEKNFFDKNKLENTDYIYYKTPLNTNFTDFEAIKDAEIISVFTSSRATENILKNFNNLKMIATRSVGISHIAQEYCKRNNIQIKNTPHYGDYTVAEFTMGLLLDVVRKITNSYNDLKDGIIDQTNIRGYELEGKTLGIIGMGAIGQKLAKIANGFGMKIIAYDVVIDKEISNIYHFEYVMLDELCKKSDFISINCPATSENFHLIDKSKINLMKKNVFIVNTSRGELINTNDLYEALKNNKIQGAAIDVLECEDTFQNPLKCINKIDCVDINCLRNTLINHRLINLKNVIITPHNAYNTYEAIEKILKITLENIKNYIQ